MPSLGLRMGMFATGATIGASATNEQDFSTRWDATLGGALLGSVVASGIDIGAFAWEPEQKRTVQPTLSFHEHGGFVGATGVF